MHKYFQLPEVVRSDCMGLINIAMMVNMLTITNHMRAMEVSRKLVANELSLTDLLDLKRLSSEMKSLQGLTFELRTNICNLHDALDACAQIAARPTMTCGAYITEFD